VLNVLSEQILFGSFDFVGRSPLVEGSRHLLYVLHFALVLHHGLVLQIVHLLLDLGLRTFSVVVDVLPFCVSFLLQFLLPFLKRHKPLLPSLQFLHILNILLPQSTNMPLMRLYLLSTFVL
jgi:hypothetical protein